MSARANQAILFKPELETVIEIGESHGAAGVTIAHSGTVIGIMLPFRYKRETDCIQAIQKACPKLSYLFTKRLISGGLTVLGGEKYAAV